MDASTDRLPSPTPFEPTPERAAELGLEPAGTVVLMLVSAVDGAWAADAAIELATSWARSGRRIVLADLHLEQPMLHERVGIENLEGMVDIFLYGASIARSARPVQGRGFYLIPSGTYEPDAAAIYRHARWPKLVAGFRDAHASLVLFAPLEGADLGALARWVDRVVVLGPPPGEGVLDPVLAEDAEVAAVLVPPGFAPSHGAERRPASAREAEDRELRIPPPPERPEPKRGRGRGPAIAVALLLLLGLLGAGAFFLLRVRPDLLPAGLVPGAAGSDTLATTAAVPPPSPTRVGEALPYSVQVRAFASLAAARREMMAQQARFPDVPFFLSPEEIDRVLYFKVLAGFAPDTVMATRLRERLVSGGSVDREDAAGTWSLIQHTRFAFDLGEFPTPEAASVRADSLLASEIPSYSVVMPYSNGTRRWQLYGGAYQDSVGAEAMRQRLLAAGLNPRLVLRIGQPMPEDSVVAP